MAYATDNVVTPQGFITGSSSTTLETDPFNVNLDTGPATNLPRHILNASGTLKAVWGIQLSPIISFVSSQRYTATETAHPASGPVYYNQCYPTGYTK